MYIPITEVQCETWKPPFGVTMSTPGGEFLLNPAGHLRVIRLPLMGPGNRSPCRRAIDLLWNIVAGRDATEKESKKLRKDLYMYKPPEGMDIPNIIHLRNIQQVPGHNWPRGLLVWDMLSSKYSKFLFAANTALAMHAPAVTAIHQSTRFTKDQLLEFRYRAIKSVIAGKKNAGFSTMKGEIDGIMDTAREALKTAKEGTYFPDDMWGKQDDVSWWRKFAPDLSEWHDEQKARLTSRWHKHGSGITYWLAEKLTNEDVRGMMSGVGWMLGAQKALMESIMGNYFQNHDCLLPIHLNMDLGLLLIGTADAVQVAGLKQAIMKRAIGGSGAIMIKLNQQIAAVQEKKLGTSTRMCTSTDKWMQCGMDVNPDAELDLDNLTADVFDNVPDMTPEEVSLMRAAVRPDYFAWLEAEEKAKADEGESDYVPLGEKNNYFDRMYDETLGSASLAEAHISTEEDGTEVVLKFLRVHYAMYYRCEVDMMLRIVWPSIPRTVAETYGHLSTLAQRNMVQQARQLMLFLVIEFGSEFDYEKEFANMEIGMEVYNKPKMHVHSAEGIEVNVERVPFIVQSYVKGRSFTDQIIHANSLDSKEDRMKMLGDAYRLHSAFNKVWTIQALTKDGYFHADAHGGNLRITPDGQDLYVIDYGSFGRLDAGDRCRLIDSVLACSRLKSLEHIIPGQGLNEMSTLLLSNRTNAGIPVSTMRAALQSFESGVKMHSNQTGSDLSLNEKAFILSEMARPLSLVECELQAGLQKLYLRYRYDLAPDLALIRADTRALLHIPPTIHDTVIDVLLTFRDLAKFPPAQLQLAVSKIAQSSALQNKIITTHNHNLKQIIVFVRKTRRACKVQLAEDSPEDQLLVARKVLNYSQFLGFGPMILNWILFSSNIGQCSYSSVAMFARGIAYVTGVNQATHSTCADNEVCTWRGLGDTLTGPVLKNPKILMQLARFAMGRDSPCHDNE
jgi:hypothetical protein